MAHVMAGARHGGAELFYERLCAGLHAAGETVLCVIRRDPARAARLRASGLPVAELAFGGALDWRTSGHVRELLRDFAPDVAVSWMNRASAHMPRGPWVTVGRLGGYYDLRHYRRCDHLVGNTRGIVRWLRERGWPEARTHYLPNFPADLGAGAPAPGLDGHGRLLGLGRLHRDKAFDTLLHALALLPSATLVLAGVGPEQARLERLVSHLGVEERVRLIGWRDDVGALLAACDIFVCSSRVEPLGNMVLEAWSAARPVVAAAASGPAELIRDGVDGLLVAIDDPAAMATAIGGILASPALAHRLAEAGRARFEAEFAEAPVLQAWRDLLGRLSARG